MNYKKIRSAVFAAALMAGAGMIGCASMASQEELGQLDGVNMEIKGLEQHKADLEKEQQALIASISQKEARLNEINKKKAELSSVTQ